MAKYFTVFLFAVLVLSACEKDNEDNVPKPHPVMQYKDLHNAEVKIGQPQRLDLDDDGITDFNFGVLLLGDPILQRDRLQFYAFSKPERKESPYIFVNCKAAPNIIENIKNKAIL